MLVAMADCLADIQERSGTDIDAVSRKAFRKTD